MKTNSTKVLWKDRRLPGPVLYYGGKSNWYLPRIIKVLPITKVYVEPYGGAGSILFTKDRSEVEVYSDLDERLVNLMTVLRDQDWFSLYRKAYFTLYHRQEFVDALEMSLDKNREPVERAWAFFVAQNLGYGGISSLPGHWGRAFTDDKGVAKKVRTFYLRVDRIPRQHQRLEGVKVLQEDALDLIDKYDSKDCCFFLDPPYVPESRVNRKVYAVDQPVEHHIELIDKILGCDGAVVLCGYENSIYEKLTDAGWEKIKFSAYASAAARNRGIKTVGTGNLKKNASRTEIIWRNQKARDLKPL